MSRDFIVAMGLDSLTDGAGGYNPRSTLRTLLLAGKLEAWAGGECCGGWSPPQRCVGVCRAGLSLGGPLEDTRAAHWLLAPDAPAPDCTLPALHATLLRENQARDRSPAR